MPFSREIVSAPNVEAKSTHRPGGRIVAATAALALAGGLASGCAAISGTEKRVAQNNMQSSIAEGELVSATLHCNSGSALQQRVIVNGGTSKPNSAWAAGINVFYVNKSGTRQETEHGEVFVGGRYKIRGKVAIRPLTTLLIAIRQF